MVRRSAQLSERVIASVAAVTNSGSKTFPWRWAASYVATKATGLLMLHILPYCGVRPRTAIGLLQPLSHSAAEVCPPRVSASATASFSAWRKRLRTSCWVDRRCPPGGRCAECVVDGTVVPPPLADVSECAWVDGEASLDGVAALVPQLHQNTGHARPNSTTTSARALAPPRARPHPACRRRQRTSTSRRAVLGTCSCIRLRAAVSWSNRGRSASFRVRRGPT
jgi:hypothetical protein